MRDLGIRRWNSTFQADGARKEDAAVVSKDADVAEVAEVAETPGIAPEALDEPDAPEASDAQAPRRPSMGHFTSEALKFRGLRGLGAL